MPNIITITKKKPRITRGSTGDGIVRLDAEAADLLEALLKQAPELSVRELASNLIKYAANDTIIKVNMEE